MAPAYFIPIDASLSLEYPCQDFLDATVKPTVAAATQPLADTTKIE